jgi:hypothetical protein
MAIRLMIVSENAEYQSTPTNRPYKQGLVK